MPPVCSEETGQRSNDSVVTTRSNAIDRAINEAIADSLIGGPQLIQEKSGAVTQQDLAQEVKRQLAKVIKSELDAKIVAELKKQLKSDTNEELVAKMVSKVLARFFEIMFTRKGQWQKQLTK